MWGDRSRYAYIWLDNQVSIDKQLSISYRWGILAWVLIFNTYAWCLPRLLSQVSYLPLKACVDMHLTVSEAWVFFHYCYHSLFVYRWSYLESCHSIFATLFVKYHTLIKCNTMLYSISYIKPNATLVCYFTKEIIVIPPPKKIK